MLLRELPLRNGLRFHLNLILMCTVTPCFLLVEDKANLLFLKALLLNLINSMFLLPSLKLSAIGVMYELQKWLENYEVHDVIR
jgi:hypothetical protein